MRRAFVATVSLLLVLSMAGGTAALRNDQSHDYDSAQERTPYCMEESPAIGVDPTLSGDPIVSIPLHVTWNGETVVQLCSGEHWDSQDPSHKRSDPDADADENEGTVYVNPLGDCSHWEADEGGCLGGTDRPTGPGDGDVQHVRLTGTLPTGADNIVLVVFVNSETWGVGQSAVAIKVDNEDRSGYVAWYGEDHSDQIFGEMLGDPIGHADGNYVTLCCDAWQEGEAREDDCSQHDYTSENRNCRRDNTAITVEFGYAWLPFAPNADVDTGKALLP